MGRRDKQERPVDRVVRQLDQELARVRRELRRAERTPGGQQAPRAMSAASAPSPSAAAPTDSMGSFVKKMLTPTAREAQPSYHVRNDLFDAADTPLKQLEMDPIAFGELADESQPDLFTSSQPGGTDGEAEATSPAGGSKLVQYLSTGGIRSYKTSRRALREERNRFFTWIGLAGAALWVLYVIVR